MCSLSAIMYISNRNVYWRVFDVTSTDWDSRFVTTDDNGAEKRAMGLGIFTNYVLDKSLWITYKNICKWNKPLVAKPSYQKKNLWSDEHHQQHILDMEYNQIPWRNQDWRWGHGLAGKDRGTKHQIPWSSMMGWGHQVKDNCSGL